ncbi:hypothetical protein C1646_812165 [Rhizophagus diaphanus]|nr:hypothetical protein C1646_812165 [Rhizophagus diaphanus] [Rhizophagus sp. MUCL 43196]
MNPMQIPYPNHIFKVKSEGGAVNLCQVSQEETIEELAQRIVQDNLSEMEVKAKCKVLVESASSASSALSRLSRLRRELRKPNASDPNTTRLVNETKKKSTYVENEDIHADTI